MSIESHKDLIVWQKAMDLVDLVYQITKEFPREEIYGLVSQMRRSAISIPSNIAEGRRRGTKREFCNFLRIALGSGAELETQIEIGRRQAFVSTQDIQPAVSILEEVMKILNTMITNLQANS